MGDTSGMFFSPLSQVELDPKNAVAHCNLGVVLGDHEADAPLWVAGSMLKDTIEHLYEGNVRPPCSLEIEVKRCQP